MVSTYAGCDSNWLKAQYQRTNGDYVNSQVVAGEQSRQEAIAYYGGGEGGK